MECPLVIQSPMKNQFLIILLFQEFGILHIMSVRLKGMQNIHPHIYEVVHTPEHRTARMIGNLSLAPLLHRADDSFEARNDIRAKSLRSHQRPILRTPVIATPLAVVAGADRQVLRYPAILPSGADVPQFQARDTPAGHGQLDHRRSGKAGRIHRAFESRAPGVAGHAFRGNIFSCNE